ncbi:beta-galactosidase [Parabacteroides sp. OttesenSCG-928-G06]|nr:beta-galactosidase [Parabacteroides sp. OttesenSCG-928-K15]MDL2282151.1 beta-galactosidase [Parabacteroides sp. OttesenSCG-928-G06]
MKKTLLTTFVCLFSIITQAGTFADFKVKTVKNPVICLNGIWELNDDRKPIQVPGEVAMQGISIKHDEPVTYYKQVDIPADFKNHKIILRFDGVYSYARLWVNGEYLRDHHGGFTRWEADITQVVRPGEKADIRLEVTDKFDEISYAAGYAKHIIGGILRDVSLYAIPHNHIENLFVETDLDVNYQDAELKLQITPSSAKPLKLTFKLFDPAGKDIMPGKYKTFTVAASSGQQLHSIPISNPLKWDAEHPHLYTLLVEVSEGGKQTYTFGKKIGFREIEVEKNVFKVNGKPVKLRGACWHNVHPTLGRVSTLEYELKDIELAKRANMNFIRTSHYAPSERFVELCDEHGIYIEAESGACFVNINRPQLYGLGVTENDPAYRDRYLGQLEEMVQALRNSPSVIFWSIGNENRYGENFQLSYDWVKENDASRPVIFSFPGTVPNDKKVTDLASAHYPSYTGNIGNQRGLIVRDFRSPEMPVVFDEWAHVACYTNNTLREDPNIRSFWSESLDRMWTNMFEVPDAMGGAIWCMIDETFMMPVGLPGFGEWWGVAYAKEHLPEEYRGPTVGYGQWGIYDVWRREKPEFWGTRKAYSPVKLLSTTVQDYIPGAAVYLPIHNRYDHTDLEEVEMVYRYKGKEYKKRCAPLAPHTKGLLAIDVQPWQEGDEVEVDFYRKGECVDTYIVRIGEKPVDYTLPAASALTFEVQSEQRLLIRGAGFTVPVNLKTGQIENARVGNEVMIVAGPLLHIDAAGKNIINTIWAPEKVTYEADAHTVKVHFSGMQGETPVAYTLLINGNGVVEISCRLPEIAANRLRESGLRFVVNPAMERLQWKRKGYFSTYPANDLGALEGDVSLYASTPLVYREKPLHDWADDDTDFYYWGLEREKNNRWLTNQAKAMKENIYNYSLSKAGNKVSVLSRQGAMACRTNWNEKGELVLYVNSQWDYPELGWGNYTKGVRLTPSYDVFTLKLGHQ